VFVPLFAVLLADWLARGAHYSERDVFESPRVRWPLLAAWAAGFALYQWLSPQGPSWWTDQVEHLSPGHATLTASLPSFALAFCLTLLATRVDSLRAAARSRREPLARPR
jgi:purine-cytosine permease-like protein